MATRCLQDRVRHADEPTMKPLAPRATTALLEPDWPALVDQVLVEPDRLQLVFQPIIALQEGIVVGCGAHLEALVVSRCLEPRSGRPHAAVPRPGGAAPGPVR